LGNAGCIAFLRRKSGFPQIGAQVFHARIAGEDHNCLSATIPFEQLRGGGKIRSARKPGEYPFIAS
jgi:hypothetical protein